MFGLRTTNAIRLTATVLAMGLLAAPVTAEEQAEKAKNNWETTASRAKAKAGKPSKSEKAEKPEKAPAAAKTAQAAPQPAPSAAPSVQMPSQTQLTLLIQQTMAALGQANITNNYTVLYGLAAPSFQKINSPERLAQIFSALRRAVDVTPTILYQPILTAAPNLNDKGMLRLMGYFSTSPNNIGFDLAFVVHDGQWRLEAIAVSARPVQSVGLGTVGTR
jgi:hypothetical protein